MENHFEEDALTKQYDSHLMHRLLKYAKPYSGFLIIVVLLMLLITSMDLLRPYLMKNAIDTYISGYKKPYTIVDTSVEGSHRVGDRYIIEGNVSGGQAASIVNDKNTYYLIEGAINRDKPFNIINGKVTQENTSYNTHILTREELNSVRSKDITGVKNTALYILILVVMMFGLNYVQIYLLEYTGQHIVFNIRQQLFKHVEGLSLSFYDKNPVGRLVTRVTNDVETLNEMYTSVVVSLFKDIFILGGILIAMFILNPKLALITLASVPLVLVAAAIFKKYDRDAYREVRTKLARINSSLSENISGMKTVQIFHKEGKKFKEFDNINRDYLKASTNQIRIFAVFRPVIDLLASTTMAVMLWAGCRMILHKDIEIGVMFAFITYLMQFFAPIFDLSEKYDILQSSMASSERIFTLLDNEDKIKNPENPKLMNGVKGEIEFKNVWFAYNDEDWVLRDVSFTIRPGENIAFVGATGAGKTSIISLISRLYDIQKGEILLDGVNIKHMEKEQLRRNIATVLQDVFLFTGDIKSNIRLNNEVISDEDIIASSKYVNAHGFIEKLPHGYDSYVNERGTTFSQGQRQLIAFARAIAFNPPILVLDEATSNIDTETEVLIQDALKKITKGRTTIVVAHRLSTIKNSDKIIVLHKGKIREMGTHKELLEKGGIYSNLYELQYKELEDN